MDVARAEGMLGWGHVALNLAPRGRGRAGRTARGGRLPGHQRPAAVTGDGYYEAVVLDAEGNRSRSSADDRRATVRPKLSEPRPAVLDSQRREGRDSWSTWTTWAERSGIASFSFVEVHSTSLRRADVLGGPLQV